MVKEADEEALLPIDLSENPQKSQVSANADWLVQKIAPISQLYYFGPQTHIQHRTRGIEMCIE